MTPIQYLHHVPGRLRIKVNQFQCDGERARRAVALLQATDGVEEVRINPRAGSLTVLYDPGARSHTELLAALQQAGCLNLAGLPAPPRAGAVQSSRRTDLAGTFGKALVGALAQRTATRLIGALL
jgi:copper chaperone CopZ